MLSNDNTLATSLVTQLELLHEKTAILEAREIPFLPDFKMWNTHILFSGGGPEGDKM